MEAIQIYVKAEVPCVEGYNGGDQTCAVRWAERCPSLIGRTLVGLIEGHSRVQRHANMSFFLVSEAVNAIADPLAKDGKSFLL